MISKQYFEETFSLATAQALQVWANDNLIAQSDGDYGMKISYGGSADMFAETLLTNLSVGTETTLRLDMKEIVSNSFKMYINSLANDNTSSEFEFGWGVGQRTLTFTPTAETMYFAIGDIGGTDITYSIVDNVKLSIGTIQNGTFEDGTTDGWYAQNSGATLEVYSYSVAPPSDESVYTEHFTIPEYDAGDPSHVEITTSNGNESLLNTASKKHFYVRAGDYGATPWNLTTDGTSVEPRTISLLDDSNLHPAQMDRASLALYAVNFQASYWIVDRNAMFDEPGIEVFRFNPDATNNIVNRPYHDGCRVSAMFKRRADSNTVQKARFTNMPLASRRDDGVCISFFEWTSTTTWSCKDNKILDCEIVNMNDGIQTVIFSVDGSQQVVNVEGTILDGNHIYITDELYADSDGTPNVNGYYATAENAIDLKAGSANASNPMIITNNKWWGFRKTVTGDGGAYDDPGYGLVGHYGIGNFIMNDNVIFDNHIGFGFGDSGDASYAGFDGEIKGNLVYDCGDKGTGTVWTALLSSCRNIDMQDNNIVQCNNDVYFSYCTDMTWINNTINLSDPITVANDTNGTYTPNTVDDTGFTEDYVFTTDKYTNSPREITLTNGVKP